MYRRTSDIDVAVVGTSARAVVAAVGELPVEIGTADLIELNRDTPFTGICRNTVPVSE